MKSRTEYPFPVCQIVAMDQARVIGVNNTLPWHIPGDIKRFAELTTGHTVLMGRKTYESLPEKFRPLPRRKNIVISRKPELLTVPSGVDVFASPEQALLSLIKEPERLVGDRLWIIGGGEIYRQTLPLTSHMYLTFVEGKHEGDVFFPAFEDQFELTDREVHKGHEYRVYQRIRQ